MSRERDDELVLDVGSSEDYSTSDESEDDFTIEVTPIDYPAFKMALTKPHIQQTLVSIGLPRCVASKYITDTLDV